MLKRILITCLILAACFGLISYRNNGADVHYTNQVAVLEYHHIDPEESEYTISPERFKEHLAALLAHHYQVISIEQLIGFLQNKQTVPPNAVVITFDDGYESYYKYAYPELKEAGMTATNFLIINDLESEGEVPPFLKWDEIKQMKADGFSFYSHTFASHGFSVDDKGKQVSPLTNPIYLPEEKRMETDSEYRTRVRGDLGQAENALRGQLGNTLSILCLPHGRYNKTLLQLGNEEGIQYFVTGDYGLNRSGDQLIKRVTTGVPTLTGEGMVDKINFETTVLGHIEDILKNTLLQFRYRYM